MDTNPKANEAAVVIIGAGISGMCIAIDMIRRNRSRNFIILEKGSRVGGTWGDNQYPGCCCDVWSHLYSYSFEPNPNWSTMYPEHKEIHAYLVGVAEKWSLFRHIRFNSLVEEARWDNQAYKWTTKVQVLGGKDAEYTQSYTVSSDFLISGVGQLNYPLYPDIEGMKSFEGKMMHTARWDSSYDLSGKRIAVIGNGASAVQVVPEVAKTAASVVVFQRTPNWIIPRQDKSISTTMQNIYRYVPLVRKQYRKMLMDFRETFHGIAIADSAFNTEARQLCLEMMERQIPNNQKLRDALTPDYTPGCKRVLLSDDYYVALNKPHVALETAPIETFTAKGIKTTESEYEFDLVVLATGFRTTQFMFPMKIYGADGQAVDELWDKQGAARAYLGIAVETLPNFAMLYGPNTNLSHSSIILMIEAQSRYISTLIRPVLLAWAKGARLAIQPSPQSLALYNAKVQENLSKTTFADPKCNSWYKNAEGVITTNWYGTVVEYQKLTSVVNWDDYILSSPDRRQILPKGRLDIGRVVEESTLSTSSLVWSLLAVMAVVGCGLYNGAVTSLFRLRS
ncbi:hypothetical protein GGS23DRAFT_179258 [Durotheca rogersii]|uniref:uncharacterized protein n=1 Tax=Durotheca rogersii TaxID=419775 RepID=UPI002220A9F5|nr:uncharacterized protein GGS23DRAFT_179258 [Durotheca rogersii]KAI5867470.1 hypothetical protein GGS23DRAFT_179258 [Durotheca rogersii]